MHNAFINHRLDSTKALLPSRNALWRWVGRAFYASISTAVLRACRVPACTTHRSISARRAAAAYIVAVASILFTCKLKSTTQPAWSRCAVGCSCSWRSHPAPSGAAPLVRAAVGRYVPPGPPAALAPARAATPGAPHWKSARLHVGSLAQGRGAFGEKGCQRAALFALLGTKLAHRARVRTIKHRPER